MYGGAEVQLERTRESLVRLGVTVDLYSQWDREVLDRVDILHWFHIDPSSIEILRIARQRGLKVVISAIFWPRRPWLEPLWTRVSGLPKKFGIPLTSYFAMARDTLRLADIVIASSKSEANHIKRIFGIPEKRLRVVPVGVSPDFARASPELFISKYGLRDFVLCVGRVEPRKNQLRLLQALRNSGIPIVIIGDCLIRPEYYKRCQEISYPGVHFLGRLDHKDPVLASAYAAARVLALPSLLETPGLVALEGALAGCRLAVTTIGNTHEYFQHYAQYVNPRSISSIRKGILKAYQMDQKRVQDLRELILNTYTWDAVGQSIASIYNELLRVP